MTATTVACRRDETMYEHESEVRMQQKAILNVNVSDYDWVEAEAANEFDYDEADRNADDNHTSERGFPYLICGQKPFCTMLYN